MATETNKVKIVFNDLTDVVSAYIADTAASSVTQAPSDRHILLEIDAAGHIVGVEVIGASVIVPERWREHPIRQTLPTTILAELDGWLRHRWADLGRR